jgi:hypothetical protein
MPDWKQESIKGREPGWSADTPEQRKQIEAYWNWYWDIEKKYPIHRKSRAAHYLSFLDDPINLGSDAYYPLCECGSLRDPLGWGEPALFGGPFHDKCPKCRAKEEVEAFVRMSKTVHSEWDDEDWLDALYKIVPYAFDLGVLPDFWFSLKRVCR